MNSLCFRCSSFDYRDMGSVVVTAWQGDSSFRLSSWSGESVVSPSDRQSNRTSVQVDTHAHTHSNTHAHTHTYTLVWSQNTKVSESFPPTFHCVIVAIESFW